jgi:hypothetical protein
MYQGGFLKLTFCITARPTQGDKNGPSTKIIATGLNPIITNQCALVIDFKIHALNVKKFTKLHINPNINIRMVYASQRDLVALTAICGFG